MLQRRQLVAAALLGAGLIWTGALTVLSFGVRHHTADRTVYAAERPDSDSLATAMEVQEAFREVSAKTLPSVVEISVQAQVDQGNSEENEIPWNDFFSDPSEDSQTPRYYRSQGLGSGVLIRRDHDIHYILTNSHVVGSAPETITVELYDGELVEAELKGIDSRKDLAIISFEKEHSGLDPVPIGDSETLYVGDWVLALGSPYGYQQSVSSGIVSALGRRDGPGDNINDFIQTDAAINQGNSGGALVNLRGELVGINTFITTPNGGSIGLGFAIPVNNAISSANQLIESGEVRYGWLGVSLGPYGEAAAESLGYESGAGALVYQVFDGSPAWEAGIRPGDLIRSLNGRAVKDTEHLIYRIGDIPPGESALFSLSRFGEDLEPEAIIGERESEEAVRALHGQAWPGFVVAPLTADLKEAMSLDKASSGVLVAEVYPRTRAQATELRPGDLIIAVGGNSVTDMKSLYLGLSVVDQDDLSFTVIREGEELKLASVTGVQL